MRAFSIWEYASFFEDAEVKQQKKLEVLTRGELAGIEETIVMQQALDKQMENIERRRIEIFRQAGYEGKRFREVIEKAEGVQKEELEVLYQEIDKSIGNIKFLNQKCMKLAWTALAGMGVITREHGKSTQGYQQIRRSSGSILQTKV